MSISGRELGDGARRGRLIEDARLGVLDLLLRRVVEVLGVVGVQIESRERDGGRREPAALLLLQLAQPPLQAFAPPAQRPVDRLGRRGQPPLEDRQREADRAGPLGVRERVRPVELLAHVVADGRVEPRLLVGQPVGDGVGDALGKQRPAVELQQPFLDHAPHEVRDVRGVHAVPEAALEAVAVEQGQEELEVLLLAVVRCRRHQQQVAGEPRQELRQPVALRVLDLAAEERGRELVRLVAHHQVPARVRRLQLPLHVLVPRQLVEPGDDEVGLQEPVPAARGLEPVVGQDLEGKLEAAGELVLPLLGEAAGAHDEAALQVPARDQLLDQEPRHDRLAGARIVRQQEAQRLPRQHRLVDRRDLVRQGLDHRRVDGQHRVEKVREADALRLRHQPEQRAVAVEAPRPPRGDDLQPLLGLPVEQLVGHRSRRRLVGQLDLRAEPLHADHRHHAVGMHAADGAARSQIFETHDSRSRLPRNVTARPARSARYPGAAVAHRQERGTWTDEQRHQETLRQRAGPRPDAGDRARLGGAGYRSSRRASTG